jgi:Secreted trypsin-like serine protease
MKTKTYKRYLAVTVSLLVSVNIGLSQTEVSRDRVKVAADFAEETSKGNSETFVKTFTAALALPESLNGTKLSDALLAKRNNIILWQNKPQDLIYASPCFRDRYRTLIKQGVAGTRIIGGRPAAPLELESCVAIGNDGGYFCTGTLIAKRLVLTAGHCFPEGPSKILVGNSISGGGVEYPVTKNGSFQHQPYNENSAPHNDLTLLVLEKDVSGVQPVKIASTTECDNMQFVRIAGFGTTDVTGRYGFGTKRIADVVVVSSDGKKCNGQNYGADPDLEFVAEDRHADTCKGDSGGPAYLKSPSGEWLLAGATSRATASSSMPCGDGGIYVRVEKYTPWVKQVAAANGLSFP